MIRRIGVALDPSEFSKNALALACRRAVTNNATVVGVTVINRPGIERHEAGANIGAFEYQMRAITRNLEKATATCHSVATAFEEHCQAEGVAFETHIRDGDPAAEIAFVARSCDVLCVGSQTYFHHETQDEPGNTLVKLTRDRSTPVIVVPLEAKRVTRHALILYDGSPIATRAMRTFAQVYGHSWGDSKAIKTTLFRIDNMESDIAEEMEMEARFLKAHGFIVDVRVEEGDPTRHIVEVAEAHAPGLVVLGTRGFGALGEIFFGSTTRALIESGKASLFISA